jgi:hypothetical protein
MEGKSSTVLGSQEELSKEQLASEPSRIANREMNYCSRMMYLTGNRI